MQIDTLKHHTTLPSSENLPRLHTSESNNTLTSSPGGSSPQASSTTETPRQQSFIRRRSSIILKETPNLYKTDVFNTAFWGLAVVRFAITAESPETSALMKTVCSLVAATTGAKSLSFASNILEKSICYNHESVKEMLSKVSQTLSSEPVDVGLFTSVTGYFVIKGTESLEKGDQGLAYMLSVGFGLKTLSILLNIKNDNQNQSQSADTQNNTISSTTNDAINQVLSFIKSLNKSAAFNTTVFGLSTISFGIASYDAPQISDIVINSVITGALGVIALSTAYNAVAKNSETIVQTPINLETV